MKNLQIGFKTALLCMLGIGGALMSNTASADPRSEIVAARVAVRDTICRKLECKNVVFLSASRNFLSLSEVTITGEGYVSEQDKWDTRRFEYSVKVNRTNYRVRDVAVRMTGAEDNVYNDYPDWSTARGYEEYAGHFTRPTRFQSFPTGRVRFEGVLRVPKATLTVYDQDGDRVLSETIRRRNGKFVFTRTLRPGVYRAVLGMGRDMDSDEVRFAVDWDASVDWGWNRDRNWDPDRTNDRRVEVTYPDNGAVIRADRVEFSGVSNGNTVNIRIYNSRGTMLKDTNLRVMNGQWSFIMDLDPGRYRVVARSSNGRIHEISFSVEAR